MLLFRNIELFIYIDQNGLFVDSGTAEINVKFFPGIQKNQTGFYH